MQKIVFSEKALYLISQVLETSPGIRPETREDLIEQAKAHLQQVLEKRDPDMGTKKFGVPLTVNEILISIADPELFDMARPHLAEKKINKPLALKIGEHLHSPHLQQVCIFWAQAAESQQFGKCALEIAVELAKNKKTAALEAFSPFVLNFEKALDYPKWADLALDLQKISPKLQPTLLRLFIHALSNETIAEKACLEDINSSRCFSLFLVLRCHPHINLSTRILELPPHPHATRGLQAPTTTHMLKSFQSAHKKVHLQHQDLDPLRLLDVRRGSFVNNITRALGLLSHKQAKKQAKKERQIKNGRFT